MRLTQNRVRGLVVLAIVALLLAVAWRAIRSDEDDAAPAIEATAGAAMAAPRGAGDAAAAGASPVGDGEADGAEGAKAPLMRCHDEHRAALRRRTEALATRPDARSQLAFALMAKSVFAGEPRMSAQRASQALADAVARAPGDPLAAWLQAMDCSERGHCSDEQAVERLLALEPDNLAAWLLAIQSAVADERMAHADALLLQAATQASRFDVHWSESTRLLLKTLRPLPVPACTEASAAIAQQFELDRLGTPDDWTAMAAHSASTAQLPGLSGLFALCPPRRVIARARQEACRAVYARMADSNELLYRNAAIRAMARHAATLDERKQWRGRLRDLAWLMQEGGPLLRGAHLPLVWERGEVPVMIALLEEQKRWPAPPRWLPRDRATRLLIEPPPPPPPKYKRRKRRR